MFFYDAALQLYINDEPLLISSRIQRVAKSIGITLKWDQRGYVHQILYDEVKALSAELGIVMLSVRDFTNLAKREPRAASQDFAEWLDLGVPSSARHPNYKIRECYQSRPPPIDNPLDSVWIEYEQKTLRRDDKEIFDFFRSQNLDESSVPADGLDRFLFEKNKERLVELSGKKRLVEDNFVALKSLNIDNVAKALASRRDADTTYVTGHDQADADAVVGAVFEAVRRNVLYGKRCVAWSERIPLVARHILGPEICDILTETPKPGPTNDIVLVDCHSIGEACESQVKAIIDHHIITRTLPYYLSMGQEVSWSSTIQVYTKFLGSGLDLDCQTARMLLEATLTKAEPSSMEGMSQLDQIALDRLTMLAQRNESYPSLVSLLTRDAMSGDPFMLDFKEGLFACSVIKPQQTAASYASQAQV